MTNYDIDIDDREYFDARTFCCPECERPNQFGELCEACRAEIAAEANEQGE